MPERTPSPEPTRLQRNIERALCDASFENHDILPMVEALARAAEVGSPAYVFANRQIAELVLEDQPWRATVAARCVAKHTPDDDGARAIQGLALTLLGHYHLAARAYRAALAIAPNNPWYSHNLGHLLDVALGRPEDAVPHLRRAHETDPHSEIAASFAHALARIGHLTEARKVLKRALGAMAPTKEEAELLAWIESGAPEPKRSTRERLKRG